MIFRYFNIYKKLALAFGITILAIVGGSVMTYSILEKNIDIIRKIANIHAPSEEKLHDLYYAVSNSKMLIKNWVFIEVKSETPNKQDLVAFHEKRYPRLKREINELSKDWKQEERRQYKIVEELIEDSLIPQHQYIMNRLDRFEAYDNPMILFETMSMVEQEDDKVMALSNNILRKLDRLTNSISEKFDFARTRMEASNHRVRKAVWIIGIGLIVISISVGLFLSHLIIKPINILKSATQEIRRGNLSVTVALNSRDELQTLGDNFDAMTESLRLNRRKLQQTNQELKASQQKLEKSNATKDKFFSIIAHDLRAPFNAFVSVSDALADDYDTLSEERKKSFARNINNSARHLNNLIENLLQWSRSQTDRLVYSPEVADLNSLINENIKLSKTHAQSKNISLINNLNSERLVFCDKNLINVVFRNLISNAIKYSPEGGKVETGIFQAAGNGMLTVYVLDYGIGLTQEDINKLFRIDQNTKFIGQSTEKGTGLGLILCKEFIEKHGGEIWVESEINTGSRFLFTLPAY